MPIDETDQLRLNVLLAEKPQAPKVSESRIALHVLTDLAEALIPLHPKPKSNQCLNQVREYLSYYVPGSPSGYPMIQAYMHL